MNPLALLTIMECFLIYLLMKARNNVLLKGRNGRTVTKSLVTAYPVEAISKDHCQQSIDLIRCSRLGSGDQKVVERTDGLAILLTHLPRGKSFLSFRSLPYSTTTQWPIILWENENVRADLPARGTNHTKGTMSCDVAFSNMIWVLL